jgi:hypothetical protein
MLERQQAQELSQRVLKRVGEDQAEVVLIFKEHALTRFANNAIHQNVSEVNLTVYLRLLHGKRLGLASTNRQDPAALDELIARARMNAQASPEDPDHPDLIKPKEYSSLDCFDLSGLLRSIDCLVPTPREGRPGRHCMPHSTGKGVERIRSVLYRGQRYLGRQYEWSLRLPHTYRC